MNHEPECYRPEQTIIFPCICDRLRACEQRVLGGAQVRDAVRAAHDLGRDKGVQAARDAVAAAASTGQGPAMPAREWVHTSSALAAIDALRGGNNG